MFAHQVSRTTIEVDGLTASYLTAGEETDPPLILLHGTYWSRVWQPVLPGLAAEGLRPVAVDLPGLGRSAGSLTPETASVPELAAWVERFVAALGATEPVSLVGHDIGGAIVQHLAVAGSLPVRRLALVNSVTYDSWPVPAVERFRDPAVVASTSVSELLAGRHRALTTALARAASEEEITEYLEPWTDVRGARSWMALAAAADSRHTLDLVPALRASPIPKLLVWGEDDPFQEVAHAERFAAEIPRTTLVRVARAGHIPMENDPGAVVRALAGFCA